MPADTKYAHVERHASKLPTLHKGELTPLVIDDMILACTNYFNAKDTAADKQVATVLGCFMDPHFTNWVRPAATRTRLIALTFPEFMSEFKEKFLDDDWETLVRSDVMSMRQGADETFDQFATSLISHTSLLADSAPISDVQTRHQLEAGMADDLRFICMRNEKLKELIAKPTSTLDQYIRAVNRLDEERRRNLDVQRRLITEANKENKRKFRDTDNDERAPKRRDAKSGKPTSATSSSANPYPPKLTDAERQLLKDNEGCNRCRKAFAGHCFDDCPDPMTAETHVTVTEKTVADARKARKGKSSSNAAASSSKALAAVMPPVTGDSDSSLDIDDELSREVSTSPPPTPFPISCGTVSWTAPRAPSPSACGHSLTMAAI
ncbi:hypothetical protein C8R44DRAFT_878584 [Mycena epipterygia]|nr:hypothetical protein C8R44DRAFT_878584 [Mycena epipterygia]